MTGPDKPWPGPIERVDLEDVRGNPILSLNIPAWFKRPQVLVAGLRVFVAVTPETLGVRVLEDEAAPAPAASIYREAFSYVVPEPGGSPTTLSAELAELRDLRSFRKTVLDPLMQPSSEGTILTRIVDAIGGQGFSDTAGKVAREQANR